MHPDYMRIYSSKPIPSISDIFLRKKHVTTYKNYISFIGNILSSQFSPDDSRNRFLQLCAVNKTVRTLALDMQHGILESPINGQGDIRHFEQCPVCPKCGRLYDCGLTTTEPAPYSIPFDISLYPAVSFPWKISRLINTFATIGSVCNNSFSFDEYNQRSILIEPVNLLIMKNGFHSAASGIYDASAICFPEKYCDISGLYDDIYFDGISFRHQKCNTVLEYPGNKSIGIIYEIGRLLHEQNLSLFTLVNPDESPVLSQ